MDLGTALLAVGAGDRAASFEIFSDTLDPAWIDAALHATDRATVRRRKLPAHFVVWLVIGMALFRDRSIREVVRHPDLVLPGPRRHATVTGIGVTQRMSLHGIFHQTLRPSGRTGPRRLSFAAAPVSLGGSRSEA